MKRKASTPSLFASFALSTLLSHMSALLLCTGLVHTKEYTVVLPLTPLALHAGYIGEFEFVDDHRGGKIVVELNGRCVCVMECLAASLTSAKSPPSPTV